MTKILLLETSVEQQNLLPSSHNNTYSLGMAYLDSVLKREGYNVVTKDFAQIKEEDCLAKVEELIKKFSPDILGISVMSMTRVSSYKTIKLAKNLKPSIKIILGGVHASIMYEQLLDNFPIDCIVIGEGEETIKELMPALIKGKGFEKIRGIAFKKNKKIIRTKERELIEDLDSLPFPSHEVFMNKKRTRVCMLSSRGCPHNCSFCCLHLISKRRYRIRSYQSVVAEIEHIASKFPQIKEIEFSDDTLTLNQERIISLCKEIVKRKINLKFICSARIKPASEEMFYWMQKAGFIEIRFGIETGSRKLLESIHKNITPEEVIETFKIASKFPKIKFVKFLMVGFLGENESTIKETIELVKKLQKLVPMDFFATIPLWVYPGTEVYCIMKSKGLIDDNFWLTEKPCPHFTVEYSERELYQMANKIAFETAMAMGKWTFAKLALKKFLANPGAYSKRFVDNASSLTKLFFKNAD